MDIHIEFDIQVAVPSQALTFAHNAAVAHFGGDPSFVRVDDIGTGAPISYTADGAPSLWTFAVFATYGAPY